MEECIKCASDPKQYQFSNFDFITFQELLLIEEKLSEDSKPDKCEIIVYTSHIKTEDIAEKVVINNRQRGILYKVYYLKGTPTKEQEELYGAKNLIKCSGTALDKAADFDIMIYMDSVGHKKGFFCVNFSVADAVRPCTQGRNCNNKCHYENDNLFYKKIHSNTISFILETLKPYN